MGDCLVIFNELESGDLITVKYKRLTRFLNGISRYTPKVATGYYEGEDGSFITLELHKSHRIFKIAKKQIESIIVRQRSPRKDGEW